MDLQQISAIKSALENPVNGIECELNDALSHLEDVITNEGDASKASKLFSIIFPFLNECGFHRHGSTDSSNEKNNITQEDGLALKTIGLTGVEFYTSAIATLLKKIDINDQYINHINSTVSHITGGLSRFMTVTDMFENFISSTSISESVHLQSIYISPDSLDNIERSNVEWLDKNTHWQNINLANFVGIPCLRDNSIKRLESHGSICLAEGLGSLIIHPYILESVCVCPVYSGWVNKIENNYI